MKVTFGTDSGGLKMRQWQKYFAIENSVMILKAPQD